MFCFKKKRDPNQQNPRTPAMQRLQGNTKHGGGEQGEVLPDSSFGAPSLRRPSSAPAWSPACACAGAGGERRSPARGAQRPGGTPPSAAAPPGRLCGARRERGGDRRGARALGGGFRSASGAPRCHGPLVTRAG